MRGPRVTSRAVMAVRIASVLALTVLLAQLWAPGHIHDARRGGTEPQVIDGFCGVCEARSHAGAALPSHAANAVELVRHSPPLAPLPVDREPTPRVGHSLARAPPVS